ncbi:MULTISPECIES: NUDIX hydrolase [Cupriavidus]
MPVTRTGQVYLIREYRHGFGEILTGLPGGLIDDGESCMTAAARELREETGLTACAPLLLTGKMIVNPSTHSNIGYSVLALVTEPSEPVITSPELDIEVVRFGLAELIDIVLNNSESLSGYDVASILRGVFSLYKFPGIELDISSNLREKLRLA